MNFRLRTSALAIAAALAFPLASPAFAQALTITDISVTGENGFSITVPSIEAVDSSLDEAGIRALFGTDFASTFTNLATLDATSLKVPTISMSYNVPALDGTNTTAPRPSSIPTSR